MMMESLLRRILVIITILFFRVVLGQHPTPTPSPTYSDSASEYESTNVTTRFKGIEIVLDDKLVRDKMYQILFTEGVSRVAQVHPGQVHAFEFQDLGSDQLLESLQNRNMSLYSISFMITAYSRQEMSNIVELLETATAKASREGTLNLIDTVNMLIVEHLFHGGMENSTDEIQIDHSDFVAWTRDFTRLNGVCYWPLGEFGMILQSEAEDISRVCNVSLQDGEYTLIMLSGINALIVHSAPLLTGPVLAGVSLGDIQGTIGSEEITNDDDDNNKNGDDDDDDDKSKRLMSDIAIAGLAIFILMCFLGTIGCSVRYNRQLVQKEMAVMKTIKKQELQLERMRGAWFIDQNDITLIEPIGRGVAGIVYKGRMNHTNWDVAIKVAFDSGDIETGDDAEISFLRQCRHSRLVMFLGCGKYLCMYIQKSRDIP